MFDLIVVGIIGVALVLFGNLLKVINGKIVGFIVFKVFPIISGLYLIFYFMLEYFNK